MRDHMTAADRLAPIDDKRSRAIRYLREHSKTGYCLDAPVRRLPAQSRQPTLLDRWIARRT